MDSVRGFDSLPHLFRLTANRLAGDREPKTEVETLLSRTTSGRVFVADTDLTLALSQALCWQNAGSSRFLSQSARS
jgi:hypothetical protein